MTLLDRLGKRIHRWLTRKYIYAPASYHNRVQFKWEGRASRFAHAWPWSWRRA